MSDQTRTVLLLGVAAPSAFLAIFGDSIAPSFRWSLGVVSLVTLAVLLFTSEWARTRLSRKQMRVESEEARSLLACERFLEAALAFQRAIDLGGDHPRAKLGLAYCIERLGHSDLALSYYANARFSANEYDDDTLITITDYYVGALARSRTDANLELALKVADGVLSRFEGKKDPKLDELRLGRAYILLALGQEKEARARFEALSHEALDPSLRERAARGSTSAGLVELARQGPEAFFGFLRSGADVIH